MHDHCPCGAILRIGTIEYWGFDGWCCKKCRAQLTGEQVNLLVPKPAQTPRRRWWGR